MNLLLSLALMLSGAAADGPDSSAYIGTWVYQALDVPFNPEKQGKVDSFFSDMRIEFGEEWSYTAKLMNVDEQGTWSLDTSGTKITLNNPKVGEKEMPVEIIDEETIIIVMGPGRFKMRLEEEED